MQNVVFTIAVTLICRAFALRDRLLGRLRHRQEITGVQVSRREIQRGAHTLDSIFVAPVRRPKAALLICHGIGEVVENWLTAQQLLAVHGIASLVFDYSGFGKSGGTVDWRACEDDAESAFSFFRTLVADVPITLLGFSMGSGIASAVLHRTSPAQLILCSAFTGFRDAACSLGLPRAFACVLPPVWSARETLSNCSVPVLVVHCERDRAFPVRMAEELTALCPEGTELALIPKQAHNEAFYDPKLSYWKHVIERIVPDYSCGSEATH
jgi:alpha-beta hydrolase superfamily lysophospholipase